MWTSPLNLLHVELDQRRDEGAAIPDDLRQRILALHPQHDAWSGERIMPLYAEVQALPGDAALAAAEPDDLAAIRALRPPSEPLPGWTPEGDELIDRLHGAWTGRAVGCALGKPVEGMGMSSRGGQLAGRRRIKAYLQARGDWPLADYISGRDAGDGEKLMCPASQREAIAFMEPDDDIHYTLVGLGVIERFGPDFTWVDVARFWLDHIPYSHICTAERQAILTVAGRFMGDRGIAATPAFTRRHLNPYREWIGAQIRSDGWAYVCAGRPELAAEFAWRDAHWTHARNGIYGEMMLAAMQAAAFVESDPLRLVAIGLGQIPAHCRLAIAVRDLVTALPGLADWEAGCAWIEERCARISPTHTFGAPHPGGPAITAGMNPIHTINNALICVLSLVHGRMDTARSPSIAVMCGLDTDCNGASVGSIVGAAAGRARFSASLADRLHDTIKPAMVGFGEVRMRELAERTAAQWRRVGEWLAGGRKPPAAGG